MWKLGVRSGGQVDVRFQLSTTLGFRFGLVRVVGVARKVYARIFNDTFPCS